MRSNAMKTCAVGAMLICGIVGSANAAIVIDPFTQASDALAGASSTNIDQSGSWLGGTFDRRTTSATRGIGGTTPAGGVATSSRSQTGGGSWVGTFTGSRPNTTFGSTAMLSFQNANSSAVAIDFDRIMIDVTFSGTARNAGSFVAFSVMDSSGNESIAQMIFAGSQLSASSLHIEFSKGQFVDAAENPSAFNWSQVTVLGVSMQTAGATGSGQTWTASNFQMTAIPAPGAAALVGLAGLVGGRRRRA